MQPTINIQLTPAALSYIQQVLEKNKAPGFRLTVKKTGCSGFSYLPEVANTVNENDIKLLINDLTILIDAKWAAFFQGLIIDFVEDMKSGLKQKRLVFSNPNESSRCGCGESFHIEDGE